MILNKKVFLLLFLVLSLSFVIIGCSDDEETKDIDTSQESRIVTEISLQDLNQSNNFNLDKLRVTAKSETVNNVSKTEDIELGQEEIEVVFADLPAAWWRIKVEAICEDGYTNYSGVSNEFKLSFEERATIDDIELKLTKADLRMPVEVPTDLNPDLGEIELVGVDLDDSIDFSSGETEFFFSDLKPGDYTLKGEFEIGDNTIDGEKKISILPGRENVISLNLSGELSIGDIKWQLPPEAPSDLNASIIFQEVNISWEHSADNIQGYYIYRSQEEDGQKRLINDYQLLENSQYTDSDVEVGESYWYWIQAVDQDGYTGELASLEIKVEIDQYDLEFGEDTYSRFHNKDVDFRVVTKTSDGGYIAAGRADQDGNDGLILKMNSKGEEEWVKAYSEGEYFYDVLQTEAHNYILVGRSDGDAHAVKIDRGGDLIWSENYSSGRFRTIKFSVDDGYVLAGQNINSRYGEMFIEINEDGNEKWRKTYGTNFNNSDREIWDLVKTNNGGYLLVGARSNDGTIINVDEKGEQKWEQEIDDASIFRAVTKTDNGYLLAGNSDDRGYLFKINKEGVYQWDKRFADDKDIYFYDIEHALDGDYILVGYKNSYQTEGQAAYVLKVDDEGQKEWNQVYDYSEDEVLWSLQSAIDGYLAVGWSESFGTGSDKDGYVIKMNRNGEIE